MNDKQAIDPDIEILLDYLRNSRGFDFSGYKRSGLTRRIDRRMQTIRVDGYAAYIDYLTVHPEEFTQLFNTILINVTSFFRDPTVWAYLAEHIIPVILEKNLPNKPIRVWSAACASGEETYSAAMLLAEAIGMENFGERVKIYATDVDEEALSKARSATYTESEVEGVPPEFLEKYFEHHDRVYTFHKDLRRSVIFGRHDVLQDAPISRVDLLLCRNLLMYLNTVTQSQVLSRLHFAIKDGGYLVLGKAEMIVAYSSMFAPVDLKTRIFHPASKPSFRDRLQMMAFGKSDDTTDQMAGQYQLFEAVFNASPIPQLIVDSSGVLALANERARSLFTITSPDIGRPFQDLQVSYRPVDLRSAIDTAYQEKTEIRLNTIPWNIAGGEKRFLDIILTPLASNGNGIIGVMISFSDISAQVRLNEKLEHANMELELAMGELQSSNEELETTNEELQSTIEELETTNEELQSSNEELETMNEELQSTNEEMEVMSEQTRIRSDELNRVNKTLEAIVTSLRGGVIVTGLDGRVLAWNRKSEDLWGLSADEVQDRLLFDLDIGLPVAELRPAVQAVLSGKQEQVTTVLPATNRRGKSIQCRINIIPLMVVDDEIEGLVIIVEDDQANPI